VFCDQSKHIEIEVPIRDRVQKGAVALQKIPTDQQVVDILTKPFERGSSICSSKGLAWWRFENTFLTKTES
jgi:hypothetical protein